MSAIMKQIEPIAFARLIFNKQMSPNNSVTNTAAIADFLPRKEQI